jgi:hypothetical protein
MAKLVVNGATLKCSEGTAPATLTVLPTGPASATMLPAATIMDYKPIANVAPFGMCKTQANPRVAAATAAAQGTLTPQPCIPVITAPWSPGASIATIQEQKALTDNSKCTCTWSGNIEVVQAGSTIELD